MWKGQLRGTLCFVTYSNTNIAFDMIFIFFSSVHISITKIGRRKNPLLPQVIRGHIRLNLFRPWIQERKFNKVNISNKLLLLWCITYCYVLIFSSYHNMLLLRAGIKTCRALASWKMYVKLNYVLMVSSRCTYFAQPPSSAIASWNDYEGCPFKTSNRLSVLSVISL